MLADLCSTGRHPRPLEEITLPEMFRRFGADEWDALRERFRARTISGPGDDRHSPSP